jgi:general secretion pathway protein A
MYLDFYGLKELPFHVTPDPRFLYWTDQHREALDHLLFGIRERRGFIQLSGEVGTGKTTLCRACLNALGDEVETALILNPSLTETQLLRAIVTDFGIEAQTRDRLACIVALNKFLLKHNAAGRTVALFIDEAQDLTDGVMEQVRLLSNLETDRSKLIQIILCGQPELQARLAQPGLRQLRQRITVRYRIQTLRPEDAPGYLAHRLQVACGGAPSRVRFDEAAALALHSYAEGRPRVINALADHALLAGYVARRFVIDRDCVQRAVEQLAEDGDL